MSWTEQLPTTGGSGASTTWDSGSTTWDSGATLWDESGAGWVDQAATSGTWTEQT